MTLHFLCEISNIKETHSLQRFILVIVHIGFAIVHVSTRKPSTFLEGTFMHAAMQNIHIKIYKHRLNSDVLLTIK